MYDKEKGIYPPGIYVAGDDIELGNYLLESKGNGYVAFFQSYDQFLEGKIASNENFSEDFHLPLKKKGIVVEIRDSNMKKI